MLNWSTWRRDFLLIGLVLALFYGAFLSARPITVPDEARYTEIPREMVVTHDYLTPKLNYLKYFENKFNNNVSITLIITMLVIGK